MPNLNFKFILYFVFLMPVSQAFAEKSMNCDQPVENFSASPVGVFPEGFTAYDASKLKKVIAANNYYRVQEEGKNKYLNALANKDGLIIYKDLKNWDIEKYPYLSWRWRAKQFPKNGNEKYIRTNDAAASVYVVWPASMLMKVKSIKFTWSSTLDIGTYISKRFGLDHIQVLRNQKSPEVGQWVSETVDVRSLYKQYYEPGDGKAETPIAVAILSDADATDTISEADYDDFVLCRGPVAITTKPALEKNPKPVKK